MIRKTEQGREKMGFSGWVRIVHVSARKNLNSGKDYYIALTDQNAALMLENLQLYGAILALPGFDNFYAEGHLTFRNGWYVNVEKLSLLDAEGSMKDISSYCPDGFSVE